MSYANRAARALAPKARAARFAYVGQTNLDGYTG